MILRESSVQDHGATFAVYTEQTKMPWCFFTGSVSEQIAIDCFCKYGISYLENKDDIEMLLTSREGTNSAQGRCNIDSPMVHVIQVCCKDDQPLLMGLFYEGKYGWTISTAELVQCHAYTPCTLVMMTPPGCKLADICTPNRHYTTLRVFTLPCKKTRQQSPLDETESLPTQLSPNRTASLVSPAVSEKYIHEHGSPDKPGTEEISPTAPWTDTLGQHTSHQSVSRQMPLLRRSSDKVTPKTPKVPLRTDLSKKDSKLTSQPTATPLKCEDVSHPDDGIGVKWQDKNRLLEQVDSVDPRVARIVSKDEIRSSPAHKDPCKGSNSQVVQGFVTDASSKAQNGMPAIVEENVAITMPQVELPGHTTPAENHVLTADRRVLPSDASQVNVGIGPSEAEFPTNQQQVITPPIARGPSLACHVQTPDIEMRDASHSLDIRKRGIKKDGVSKSCPPSLRAGSPRLQFHRNESQEKSQKTTQRVALAKIRESSQIGKGRNKAAAGDEGTNPGISPAKVKHGSHPCGSRLVQQLQNPKSANQVEYHITDLIAKIDQEEAEQQQERRKRIIDATHKWCSCLPKPHQNKLISLGEKFLRRMDSTMCFLIVAYRMLAKPNWSRAMVAVDIKQAALYAISKGWHVKSDDFHDYPFTREEFAVSAASYLDKIPADAPEDPFRALCIAISHLPHSCAKLFSKGKVACPYCRASCDVSIPSFTSNVSWTMTYWTDIATCLNSSEPNPWMQSYGWHAADCGRSDHEPNVIAFDSWTLLELHLQRPDDFPTLLDSQKLNSDPSLALMNGQILGFVCTNTRDFTDSSMHYWFVETEDGVLRNCGRTKQEVYSQASRTPKNGKQTRQIFAPSSTVGGLFS